MENIKFIDITQLPEDLWQDAKNLIAIDSNGDVIKAEKQDSYSKDEIDGLLKDAEISADKLQNKIKINSESTDYVVTQPTVSGDSLVITDSMSDKNQYHTFGYDKTYSTTSNGLLNNSTPLFRGSNEYNCPKWDGNSIQFQFISGINFKTLLTIPYTYNGVKYVTHIDIGIKSSMYEMNLGVINDPNFPGYQSVKFKESEVYKAFGANETFVFKKNNIIKDYATLESDYTYDYVFPGDTIEMTIGNFPLTASNGALIIETPRFYILSNNFIYGDIITEYETSNYPERLSDYIRYSNDVKAYILTDKNTKFKTINGEQILGNGNIEISTDVDLSNLATKSELATKQDKLVSGTNIKSINGTSLLSSGNMELATKEELNTKQDVISDLETIRSGAALGATALQEVPSGYTTEQWVNEQGFLKEHQDISNLATKEELNTKQDVISDLDAIRSGAALGATALQSVPSEYALKSEIPDITTKQDKLVSGTNIKSINGASLLGSGNMELATKEELNSKQNILVSGENIKTVNGTSLLGSGNIEVAANVDLSDYYTKSQTNALVSPKLSQVTLTQAEYNALSIKEENVLYVISDAEDIKFKTINGEQITGNGNIELATKTELATKQDVITDLETIRSGAALGATALQSVPSGYATEQWVNSQGFLKEHQDISNLATKAELATKQDVITDLNTIRSGSALGATALQSVPSEYALKSEIPDITTKQDTLVSGTNIKTVNGISLLGEGNITIEGGADLSGYYTKAEIDSMIGGVSSTITEINNLVV